MKKVLLFTALFSSAALFTNAQDARDQFKFGVKGGATLSNVYDSDGDEFDANAKLGYTAGLTLDIPCFTKKNQSLLKDIYHFPDQLNYDKKHC